MRNAPGKQRDPGTGRRPCIGNSERRLYETNEETSTPIRDGISD